MGAARLACLFSTIIPFACPVVDENPIRSKKRVCKTTHSARNLCKDRFFSVLTGIIDETTIVWLPDLLFGPVR